MIEKMVVIKNPSGLHARPASLFVKAAAGFPGTSVKLVRNGRSGDAKSIISLLALGLVQGATLLLKVDGPEEESAAQTLVALIESGFGEL